MPNKEPAFTILKRIFDGAERTAKLYEKASGSLLTDACEYVSTVGVFERLAQSTNGPVLLEVPVSWAREEAKAVRCGRPSKADRLSGRYDLVQYWANNKPRAAIEIKSPVTNAGSNRFKADFARLSRTLLASDDSSFQFACLVVYATKAYGVKVADKAMKRKRAKDALIKLVDSIGEQAADHLGKQGKLMHRVYRGPMHFSRDMEEGAWQIAIVLFAHKKRANTFPHELFAKG